MNEAGEAQDQNQQWFRTASHRIGIWEWSLSTGQITCSPGFEVIHHRVPEEFGGTYQDILGYVHPNYREPFVAAVSEALATKSDFCLEYRVALPGETVRWVESRGHVECDDHGRSQRMIGVCVDITERRLTLDLLRQNQERYRGIVDAANDPVWLVDTQARTFYVSWQVSFLLGYATDEIMRRRLTEFCFPEDAQIVQEHVEASLRGMAQQFECRFRHKNGSVVQVFGSTSPTQVGQGSVIGALCLFWDITDRKRAEQALRQSEERFRQLAETLTDVYWVADPVSEKMVYVSPAYDRLWGRSAQSLYQDPREWIEAVHPADRERLRTFFVLSATREPFDVEYRIRRPDGSVRWIRDRRFPARNETLQVDRVIGFAEDITDRKKAEFSLRLSEGKLRALLESASEGIVAIDGEGKIILLNGKSEELFGYRREELLGQTVDVLLPEELRGVHAGHRQTYFAHPHSGAMGAGMALVGQRKDGSTFPIEVSLSFVHEGESVVVLAMITDITERKRLEERLRETAKLESLGVLAGGIAHDFNNLLTGVLGNASLAVSRLPPESSNRALIEEIMRSAERAALLTRQLLAYAGKGRFVVRQVNLSEFTRDIATLVESSISRTVQLRLELSTEVPLIEADIAQLQQVIMNLIINAAESCGDAPGVVTVRTGVREFTQEQILRDVSERGIVPGRYALLEVRDTGTGMDERTRQRIFDPFFTTKVTGRGLGLSSVLGIVSSHKGTIDVESTPGQGSIFTVLLPEWLQIRTPKAAEQQSGKVDVSGTGKVDVSGTVLIVDDDETIRKMAQTMLEQAGYTTILAENGERAVSIFEKISGQISAVLLDMTMPIMSGVETLIRLRRIKPDVPVILSSGFSELQALEWFPDRAVEGFLQKPYDMAHLTEKINSVAAASRQKSRGR